MNILQYGEIGYAVFNDKNEQITRAVYSMKFKNLVSFTNQYFKTAKEHAECLKNGLETLLNYKNLTVKKAIKRY